MSNRTVYTCKDGRLRVYEKDTKHVTSYPRIVMEEYLGRKLDSKEQIHHIDGDPNNNDISNLEIKNIGDHQREHSTKYFDKEVECFWCKKKFIWSAKQQSYHNGNRRKSMVTAPFCSKRCVGLYGQKIQSECAGVAK